jgi:multidrug transporter EmrE-like cation transporter
MSYVYVFSSILFTVYSQIVIKWQVTGAGPFPTSTAERAYFLARLLVNPWVVSALVASALAVLTWMVAMTKLDLSHAYPFASISFVLVLVLSSLLLNEPVGGYKIAGVALIVCGVIVSSQG